MQTNAVRQVQSKHEGAPVNLADLGFDTWFEEQARALREPGQELARVTAVDRGRYLVRAGGGDVPAELTGKFLYESEGSSDLPCVGDWVLVRLHDGGAHATLHHLLPRKTALARKSPGRDVEHQLLAANVDTAFLVQACGFDFNPARLERYLVMAREGRVEPVILLTKTDLVTPDEREQILAALRSSAGGAPILPVSNVSGEGVGDFERRLLPRRTYAFLGSSGVGKTTLLNRLLGGDAFATRDVSATGEGRHTTTRRRLVALANGSLLIDMPGLRELGLLGADDGLDEAFADVRAAALGCRFADCTHGDEPGCAVQAAVAAGTLDARHLANYAKLTREAAFHDLSYAERRQKDKAFGKFVRSAKKSLKKP
jgi:ribosome biogenesis GTPase